MISTQVEGNEEQDGTLELEGDGGIIGIIPANNDDIELLQQEVNNLLLNGNLTEDQLVQDIEEVMSNIVADSSKTHYKSQLAAFLVWLFHHPQSNVLLKPTVQAAFNNANLLDLQQPNSKGKKLRKASLNSLSGVKNVETCPIHIDQLSFEVVSQYMVSRRKSDGSFFSKSAYDAIRSAIMHLYRNVRLHAPDAMVKSLSHLVAGLKRTIVRERQENGDNLESGKSPINYAGYKYLCEQLLNSDSPQAIFGHCFLTLEWSLMARADNVTKTHIDHIQWRDDCMIVYFAHTKSDQEGVNQNEPWHVYANPVDPAVCPILAMAKYIFSHPELLQGDVKLFPGRSQYNRFMKLFQKLIYVNAIRLTELGNNPDNLGSHSARKGSSTLCTTGCTVCPPYISICLRAGWALPGVQNRYLHFQEAGDQYVGRTVTGLNPLSTDFAISPPYFDGDEQEITLYVDSLVPVGATNQMKALMKFFIASVLYHKPFLISTLHPNSRFRCTMLMMNTASVQQYVKTCHTWDRTERSPRITGVPPHVSLLCSMEQLLRQQSILPNLIAEKVQQVFESRVIQNGGITAAQVLAIVTQQLQSIVTSNNNRVDPSPQSSGVTNQQSRVMLHFYGGRFNLLPESFVKFPSMTLGNLITRWLIPDVEHSIPPFRILRAEDVRGVIRGKKSLHEMKRVMKFVREYGEEANVWLEPWDTHRVTALISSVHSRFHVERRRNQQITWHTVYRSLPRAVNT